MMGTPVPGERTNALPKPSRLSTMRHLVRSRVIEHPALYLPFARRKYAWPSPTVVGPETGLVIDGYMRSANTFAVYAFQFAQRRPVRLAHHLHAPAQLMEAVKRGIPALVVIRDPRDAVLSQVQWEPTVSLPAALSTYARFYTCLLPFARRLVTGEFEEVTNDFGAVVARLNERYGTSFDEFEATEENRRRCFELMEERATRIPEWYEKVRGFESGTVTLEELLTARATHRSSAGVDVTSAKGDRRRPMGEVRPRDTWIPSAHRAEIKGSLLRRYLAPNLAELRARAASAYESFLREAGELNHP